jgi:hypothetical protein
MANTQLLQGDSSRTRLMRLDTAELLTRLFYLERSLIISQAGWLPRVERIDVKAALARVLWEQSLSADNFRNRVFELRYPSRLITPDQHQKVVGLFDAARNAPSSEAFILALGTVLLPAMNNAYHQFLELSDKLSDGPTLFLLKHALLDRSDQIADLRKLATEMFKEHPEQQEEAEKWTTMLNHKLGEPETGFLFSDQEELTSFNLPGSQPFELVTTPGRDSRFQSCRFYWPHIYDSGYPSDEGVQLQLRSAVGHLNEVWAAEICAANLYNFGNELGWEYIRDLARWTYDESRHSLMGLQRLLEWGFQPDELPLGNYIYLAACRDEPIYGLGMIFYFETKYIHRGQERIKLFKNYHDQSSRHDYEFDWADETFHAEYGNRWLRELIERGISPLKDINDIRKRCEELIVQEVATATENEKQAVKTIAKNMLDKARQVLG